MSIKISGETFYDPTETAKELQISRTMVRYYIGEGKLAGTKIGNTWYHTKEQIEEGRKTIATQKGKPGRKASKTKKETGDNDTSICDAHASHSRWGGLAGVA